MSCLLCHYNPKDDKHIPAIIEDNVTICKECVTRARTVESFGVSVEELRIAAKAYRAALEGKFGITIDELRKIVDKYMEAQAKSLGDGRATIN